MVRENSLRIANSRRGGRRATNADCHDRKVDRKSPEIFLILSAYPGVYSSVGRSADKTEDNLHTSGWLNVSSSHRSSMVALLRDSRRYLGVYVELVEIDDRGASRAYRTVSINDGRERRRTDGRRRCCVDGAHWKEYSIGFFVRSTLRCVPISYAVLAPSARVAVARIQLIRDDVIGRGTPVIPQIDSDVRNSRNSFCHGKPAYSTAAWPADGLPMACRCWPAITNSTCHREPRLLSAT